MAEGLRPLTLLLGGAALWALCLLVLALGGLGTRFSAPTLSEAPPPLPKVSLTPTRSRLGAWGNYAEVGARPLLIEGRRPAAVVASAEAGSADLDVTLSSVLITSNLKLAVLTDNKDGSTRRVKLGEVVEGTAWRLVSLQPREAVVEGPSGQRALPLRVYDGTTGEAPTPLAAANTSQPPPPEAAPVPARSPPAPPVAQNASPAPPAPKADPNQMTQEQQVEAIRKRIEARRAQMRAEAEAASTQIK